MSNRLKLSLLLLSIAIGICSTYVIVAARRHRQRQAEALALIRDLDRVDQRLSQASREFGIALQQFLASDEADSGFVRQAHQTLVATVNQSIAVVSRLEPPKSDQGAAFIGAQRNFLLVQRRIIRVAFDELLRLLDDTTLALPERSVAVQVIVKDAYAETEREFAAVHAAREKFAAEFGIQLTEM